MSFGKAVKFDSLNFKYNGDIILHNFYLSNTNDFNDNINLIKCHEVVIDTCLPDLIRKKITFSGVYMSEPHIEIIKNYGKSYHETFIEELIDGVNRDYITHYLTDGFTLEFTDSYLKFRETFRKSKNEMNFRNLNFYLKYRKDSISFQSSGSVEDNSLNKWLQKSSYRITGKIYPEKKFTETDIELNNFDLSYLNSLLNDTFSTRFLITGLLSGRFKIVFDSGLIKCGVSSGFSGINLLYFEKDIPYTFFKDENLSLSCDLEFINTFDAFKIENFSLDDGPLKLYSNFKYLSGDSAYIDFKVDNINLNELSESVYLFRNCRYNGEASLYGICNYNFKEEKPDKFELNCSIKDFNIFPLKDIQRDILNIKKCSGTIKADLEKIELNTFFKSGNSDFRLKYLSKITNWAPFKSDGVMEINSEKIELAFIKNSLFRLINNIYTLAYIDTFQNFDERINFLREPEGIFINNNDMQLKLHSDKIILAGNSYLDNLNLELVLAKGIIKTTSFSLEGHNGTYDFNFYSNLRQEYPFFKFKSEGKNINLQHISEQLGMDYSFAGNLDFDMLFETSAFRIGQIVENGKAEINVTISDGYVENTSLQDKINEFFSNTDFKNPASGRVEVKNFSFSFKQIADNYYIRNLNLNSGPFIFSSYGSYTPTDGLNVPINLNIYNGSVSDRIPVELSGKLGSPCLKFRSKNSEDKNPLCF